MSPGIISEIDGWSPSDDHKPRNLQKEQEDNLRAKIGEELFQASGNFDFIELIVNDIVSVAKGRQEQSSNLVAAIHSVWGDIGLRLGQIMEKLNQEEREGQKNG